MRSARSSAARTPGSSSTTITVAAAAGGVVAVAVMGALDAPRPGGARAAGAWRTPHHGHLKEALRDPEGFLKKRPTGFPPQPPPSRPGRGRGRDSPTPASVPARPWTGAGGPPVSPT